MIGFDYNSCGLLHHMSEEEQLIFYRRMHEAFDGTNLDAGVNGAWFDEFGPEYCTNCDNCGEKFSYWSVTETSIPVSEVRRTKILLR